MLSLKGALVTIDAMGCQKEIASKIIKKKADYLLTVKKNQDNLYNTIETIFMSVESGTFPLEISEKETVNKSHGRIEKRHYSIIKDIELFSSMGEWEGLKCIGKVKRVCIIGAKESEETRYFICSKEVDIDEFSDTVRSHWGIENSLHWVLDIVFRDDESRVREKNAAANFVTLKHITLNMLKSLPGKKSMRVRRKLAGWDEGFLLEALMATPTA